MTEHLKGPTSTLTTKQRVDWRWRELSRFEDGTYEAMPEGFGFLSAAKLPEELADNPYGSGVRYARSLQSLHFVHPSVDCPTHWAYTPDEADGLADRQARVLPGKYLRTFYSDILAAEQIDAIANDWAAVNQPKMDAIIAQEEAEDLSEAAPGNLRLIHHPDTDDSYLEVEVGQNNIAQLVRVMTFNEESLDWHPQRETKEVLEMAELFAEYGTPVLKVDASQEKAA